MDMIRNIENVEVPSRYKKSKSIWVWKSSLMGHIKMNVDDFFLGISGKGCIGGVFRDFEGKVLLQFGKEVQVDSTIHEEMLVFREWILVVAASRLASSLFFLFEFDSKLVVNWVAEPLYAPW